MASGDIIEELRVTELFRLAIEAAPTGMIMATNSGEMIWVNAETERLFGYARAELMGRPVDMLVPERYRLQHSEFRTAFLGDPRSRVFGADRDLRGLQKGGAEFPVEIGLTPLETTGGRFVLASVLDVTERKRAEHDREEIRTLRGAIEVAAHKHRIDDALKRRDEQLRAVLDSIGDGIVVADAAGRFTEFNPAAQRILGLGPTEGSPEEWQRQFGLFCPDGVTPFPSHEIPLVRAIRGEATNQVEMVIRQPSLEAPNFLTVTGRPIKGPDGTINGGVVVLHEITERRRAEEALRTSNQELREFAYVASHDLQEPLRKVTAFAACLRDTQAAVLDAEGLDYLDRIQSAARRMSALVSDILEISSISSKKRAFVKVDLNQVVTGVLADLEPRLAETRGRVEVRDLPTVASDPPQMRRLLQNLIGNALKFHRKDEPPVVRVAAEIIDDACRLTVTDNGIGFDEKYLDLVFAMFQRLHGRGEFEGTGMGLAICRRIVERHGGTITARSRLGEGSTFIVTMPLVQKPRAEPAK